MENQVEVSGDYFYRGYFVYGVVFQLNPVEVLVEAQANLEDYYLYNRLELYDPYPFQREFHFIHGKDISYAALQKCLLCANQIGKTTCAANEVAYHVTGKYPKDWEGVRHTRAGVFVCARVSNDSTKRIIQRELLGGLKGSEEWGTGSIPRSHLLEPTRKAGVPDAYESVKVKGRFGTSEIWFMAYEQGWEKFQGLKFTLGAWCDEEPPMDIWSQLIRGIISQPEARLMITMTPEEGETDVVLNFRNNLEEGQAYVTATWDDAKHDNDTQNHKKGDTHLTEDRKRMLLKAIPYHQRDMRSRGIPFMGSGLVFPVREEDIICEPFDIPEYWPGLQGLDFGVDHPFADVQIRIDPESKKVYMTHEYRKRGVTPPIHREAVRDWGAYPCAWPHDGKIRDKGTGVALWEQYKKVGFNMHDTWFTNPNESLIEGQGKSSVEAGLFAMLTAFETDTLKIFSTCTGVLEEMRGYHREKGQLIKVKDDLISAFRYAYQMRRIAIAIHRTFGEGKPIKAKVSWAGLH